MTRIILITGLIILMLNTIGYTQTIEDTLMLYGRNRFYRVHLPIGYTYANTYPLVFVFHGGLGSAENIEQVTGFSSKADKENFIVVYPYGTGSFDKKLLTWNTWDCCGYARKKDIDDVSYILKLIEILKQSYNIDDKRIYATGFSNGAMLCYKLACEAPEYFSAIAPVAGTMFRPSDCGAKEQTSLVIFNSIDDKHIPYSGGIGEESIVEAATMPIDDVVEFWKNKYNCSLVSKSDGNDFQKIIFNNNIDTQIVFYRLLKGGHSWPGSEKTRLFQDRPIKNVSATDLIWEFFKDKIKK